MKPLGLAQIADHPYCDYVRELALPVVVEDDVILRPLDHLSYDARLNRCRILLDALRLGREVRSRPVPTFDSVAVERRRLMPEPHVFVALERGSVREPDDGRLFVEEFRERRGRPPPRRTTAV